MQILFENEDLVVINKEAGVVVNRSDTTNSMVTLQDLVEEKNLIDKKDPDQEFLDRGGIVHRLDKETSGAIIIARNSNSFRNLQAQFKERKVEKTYLALVHGKTEQKGEINVPMGRLPWNRKRFGVLSGGREALTYYEVISYYSNSKSKETLSYLRLNPKTGRTHQIRVHLKYINHPIFADPVYGGRKISRDDRSQLSRIFLHAAQISFNDPKTNESIKVEANLPEELSIFLQNLRQEQNMM